jgi:hypothetical protein
MTKRYKIITDSDHNALVILAHPSCPKIGDPYAWVYSVSSIRVTPLGGRFDYRNSAGEEMTLPFPDVDKGEYLWEVEATYKRVGLIANALNWLKRRKQVQLAR